MSDSRLRSLAKALSWRCWGTGISWIATYYITGDMTVSTQVSLLEAGLKVFSFYIHERLWQNIC